MVGNGQSCDAELASFYAKEELKEFKVLTMSHFWEQAMTIFLGKLVEEKNNNYVQPSSLFCNNIIQA